LPAILVERPYPIKPFMRKIIFVFILTAVFSNCYSQDTLAPLKNRDSLFFYKQSIFRGSLFKIGDTVYDVRKLKPLMRRDKESYEAFKSFRLNKTIAGGFAYVWGGSFYRVADGLINKDNVFPWICSTIGTYFLAQLFYKKSRIQRDKVITLYNLNL
jgi:hypothetical protein